MLFLVKQIHDPSTCPVAQGKEPSELYDEGTPGITLRSAVADASAHILYFLLETDDLEAIRAFLAPGLGVATSHITPVTPLV